jgi:IS30 family transposase
MGYPVSKKELQMKSYRQLSMEEMHQISTYANQGESLRSIAKRLERSPSTICRELKRTRHPNDDGIYWPYWAESLRQSRRKRLCIIDRHRELKTFIVDKLCCHYWTPEQIAGHLKCCQDIFPSVCHETIYRWIYSKNQRKEKLWKLLTRHKATRGKRKSRSKGGSRIPNRIPIGKRPIIHSSKEAFGNWEGDLMSFKKNSQHIVVLRERKTMYTLSSPLESKKALHTAQVVTTLLERVPSRSRQSMTLDNGTEFTQHSKWQAALRMPNYFCDPYKSWQKGGVENTNGRLRRDLPRSTDIKSMSQENFNEVIDNYNNTPRKLLGWKTPYEAFLQNLHCVALQP